MVVSLPVLLCIRTHDLRGPDNPSSRIAHVNTMARKLWAFLLQKSIPRLGLVYRVDTKQQAGQRLGSCRQITRSLFISNTREKNTTIIRGHLYSTFAVLKSDRMWKHLIPVATVPPLASTTLSLSSHSESPSASSKYRFPHRILTGKGTKRNSRESFYLGRSSTREIHFIFAMRFRRKPSSQQS